MQAFRIPFLAAVVSLWTVLVVGSSAAHFRREPYVQLTTPNSAVLVWRTNTVTVPVVTYGPSLTNMPNTVPSSAIVIRVDETNAVEPPEVPRLFTATPGTYQYEAKITGLAPDTRYFYSISDGPTPLTATNGSCYFRTSPPTNTSRPLRFWVVGDSGYGSQIQIDGFNAMNAFVAADQRPIDAYLHMGDMAYPTGHDSQLGANFFAIYASLLRNTVTWATMGNHEGYTGVGDQRPYYDAFVLPMEAEAGGVPSGTEQYYSFDFGPIHFISLQSYDLPRNAQGAMAQWLQADLDATHSEWLVAFWHHPPYTYGTHASDWEIELIEMREIFMPILEAAGVDLVLCGHSHVYERSMLLNGAYATPTVAEGVILDAGDGDPTEDGAYLKSVGRNPNEGTVAVVAGHGGSAYVSGPFPVFKRQIAMTGSLILDLEGDTFKGTMLGSDGAVYDRFDLKKSGQQKPKYVLLQPQPGVASTEWCPANPEPGQEMRYTLDGSDPDFDSPLVTGPIQVPTSGQLRVRTYFPGGYRQTGSTIVLGTQAQSQIQPGFAIRLPVAAPDADATQDQNGAVSLHGSNLLLPGTSGLQFPNLLLPRGSKVLSAHLQFTSALASAPSDLTIAGEAADNSAPVAEVNQNLSVRNTTNSLATWNAPAWDARGLRGIGQRSPNLAAIVQEIINRPGWQAGNTLTFLITSVSPHPATSRDDSTEPAPDLQITFLPPEWETLLAAQPQSILPPATGQPESGRFIFRRLRTAAADGISYLLETSEDLTSWQAVSWPEVLPPQTVSGLWEDATWQIPGMAPRKFMRVRISHP